MSSHELTEREKRNIELVKVWDESWDDAERLVDEVYAETADVFGVLQNHYDARRGESKEDWRALEVKLQKYFQKRAMLSRTILAKGDMVALEVFATTTNLRGKPWSSWSSVFLTFDDDGRIIRDHTCVCVPSRGRLPEWKSAHIDGTFPQGEQEVKDISTLGYELTEREKRNFERVKEWAKAWETIGDAERMVDEFYADTPEVWSAIQYFYWSRRGKSKENWRALEVANEKQFQKRTMRFVTILAKGDMVAAEVFCTTTNLRGKIWNGLASIFLTFDDDGRIITNHTYHGGPSPIDGTFPLDSPSPPEYHEAVQRLIADNIQYPVIHEFWVWKPKI